MSLRGVERRLEHLVEGTFARVFKSGLRPIEIGRKLMRELDDHRELDVRGRTVVPNAFWVRLAEDDFERFADIDDSLVRELCDAAREHAREERYSFMGPVTVELVPDGKLRTGDFRIDSRLREGPGGVGAGSLLLPNNDRYILGERAVVFGRLPDCDITLTDTNVSRRHAEIRPHGDGFVLVDLGSTNGCRVNGQRVSQRVLNDGDEIAMGNTRMIFQAS